MNWDAIGAISEALGALAVFITLVYVAIQVRHARDEIHYSLRRGRAEIGREMLLARATDARLARITSEAEALLGGGTQWAFEEALVQAGVNAVDASSLLNEQLAQFNMTHELFQQIDYMSPLDRHGFDGVLRWNYGHSRTGKLLYETWVRQNAHPDLLRYIEGVLATTP